MAGGLKKEIESQASGKRSRVLFEQGTLTQDLARLTDENRAKEERDGDVDDRGGHV